MFKKITALFLSLCIAAAMILGTVASYSNSNIQDMITMCDMSAGIFLC